jgi:septal ring factor EnvC (AmiA/AmiB activator)
MESDLITNIGGAAGGGGGVGALVAYLTAKYLQKKSDDERKEMLERLKTLEDKIQINTAQDAIRDTAIAVLETQNKSINQSLERIENKIEKLLDNIINKK